MKEDGVNMSSNSRNSRTSAAGVLAAITLVLLLAGCRHDMQEQPHYIPFRLSNFFPDQRSARPLVAGTVARGQLHADRYLNTGMIGNQVGNDMPYPVTGQVLERGRERYDIYCAPCHSRLGDGNGMIVQRGYRRPPSYHSDRLRKAPLGHFFDVMTNGFGAMPDYASQIQPADRWAIAAYIRALQLSQNAPASDVPAGTNMSRMKNPEEGRDVGTGATLPVSQAEGNVSVKGETK